MRFPLANHAVVGKDLPQLKRGTLVSLRGELDNRGIPYSYNSASGEIRLKNGCRIAAISAQNYRAFRSFEADTIWCDELSEWGPSAEEAFTRFLAPRLRYSPNGKRYEKDMKLALRITTNPPMTTSHWLYGLIVTNKFCKCYNVGLRDNFLMPQHEQYIARQERTMSPDLWPLLIDGQWGNVGSGNVYKGFSRRTHCNDPARPLPPIAMDPNKEILWSLDFNVALMCSVIGQVYVQKSLYDPQLHQRNINRPVTAMNDYKRKEAPDYQDAIFYIHEEMRLKNSSSPEVAEAFIARYGEHARRTGVVLYGDASGSARAQTMHSQSSAKSNWAIIIQALQQAGIKVSLRLQSANPTVWDRINAVKSQLMTKDGPGLFINPDRCPYLVVDLESVSWKQGENVIDQDTDPTLTHLSDAMGYMIWVERTLRNGFAVNWQNPLTP
jgi:hypothetical protein